jgi:serine/threonine protein kinase
MTTTLFATPVERLATFFDPAQPRETYEDAEIDEIASLLKRCVNVGSKCPRTYIVLRTIGELDILGRLLTEGFTDEMFPVERRGLPSFLSPATKFKFVQTQGMVMTKSLDLEHGRHRHFAPGEPLPFDILERLGSGGYGQVDKIASKISFRHYALKRIRRGAAFGKNSKEAMKTFKGEIRIVKGIEHRHIIQYVGSYTDRTYLGLVMAPVADMDLAAFLERTCVDVQATSAANTGSLVERLRDQALASEMCATVRMYFGCLAAALAYLHERSIRHKDLKPQNILVHQGNVLLTDFGLSREFADDIGSTTSGTTPVSRRYCPPEVALYKARNTSADIWSLGCVFLEMTAALHGHNVDWMKRYYATLSTTSPHFYANPEATAQLIGEWETTWTARDRIPLLWITKMLHMDRLRRPTAAQTFEYTTASEDVDQGPTTFCGICCAYGEETDSCDSLVDEPTILDVSSRLAVRLSTNTRPAHETSVAIPVSKYLRARSLQDVFTAQSIQEGHNVANATVTLRDGNLDTANPSDSGSVEPLYSNPEAEPGNSGLHILDDLSLIQEFQNRLNAGSLSTRNSTGILQFPRRSNQDDVVAVVLGRVLVFPMKQWLSLVLTIRARIMLFLL